MPKLGQIIYYTSDFAHDHAVYPAIVTAVEDGGRLGLTVFTPAISLYREQVPHGQLGQPETWCVEGPESQFAGSAPPTKTGFCGRCAHPASAHPEDHGRRCVEPGCGCMAWQQVEESLGGGGDDLVIVQMPARAPKDPQNLVIEDAGERLHLESADFVVAVWPDGFHRVVESGGLDRWIKVVDAGGRSTRPEEPNPVVEARHFAEAFMTRYGRQRQTIDEDLLVEWFRAAMTGGEIPRARP